MSQIQDLQNALLDSWKNLKPILDENQIRYFAIGGTAIGTFREKGFISWDDDMDIAIFAEDMPKLKEIISKSNRFSFEVSETKDDQILHLYKVYDKKYKVESYKSGVKRTLFIDIFPAYLEKEWGVKNRRKRNFLRFIGEVKRNHFKEIRKNEGLFIAIGYSFLKFILLPFTRKFLNERNLKSIDRVQQKVGADKNNRFLYHVKDNEFYNVSSILELPFEDSQMKVNASFPEDTKSFFGDIFVKPKEQDKHIHNLELVKEA